MNTRTPRYSICCGETHGPSHCIVCLALTTIGKHGRASRASMQGLTSSCEDFWGSGKRYYRNYRTADTWRKSATEVSCTIYHHHIVAPSHPLLGRPSRREPISRTLPEQICTTRRSSTLPATRLNDGNPILSELELSLPHSTALHSSPRRRIQYLQVPLMQPSLGILLVSGHLLSRSSLMIW
jgi:hypothetical protein